jgi:peptidoglycan/LPS O-acetylase OafA/YrhL
MNPIGDTRYHALDAWRGVACLLVIGTHATAHVSRASVFSWYDPASWLISATERMWVGVPMFFVISGYCIAAAADAGRRRGDPRIDYFTRRIRRIYPPYLAALLLCIGLVFVLEAFRPGIMCVGVYGFPHPTELNLCNWVGNITLTEGWRGHFIGPKPAVWMLGPAWTLGFEEQFYAITGLILLATPKHFFRGIALVTGLVIAWMLFHGGAQGLFFDGRWLHFAAGVLVFYGVNYLPRRQQWFVGIPLLLGIAWAITDPERLLEQEKNWHLDSLAAYAFALVLLALHPLDRSLAGRGWLKPLSACGVLCYSIYLMHWPLCKAISHFLFDLGWQSPASAVLGTLPICLVTSVGAGWLFHRTVERRFLNASRRRAVGSGSSHVAAPRQPLSAENARPSLIDAASRRVVELGNAGAVLRPHFSTAAPDALNAQEQLAAVHPQGNAPQHEQHR